MKKQILLFVSVVTLLFSSSANASVTVGVISQGVAGQDSFRVYVNLINCTDTDRVAWVRYGNGFVNSTANQQLQLGNSQVSFLLTGLSAGTGVPIKFCHWRPSESVSCTAADTFYTADPPFVTTVDLISGAMTDSGLVIYFDLNTTAPALLQPFWDAADTIGSNPQYGNVENYAATNGMESKYLLVQNWFLPDTYAVAIRFQNDSLLQIGQFGYSDTLPPMILSGIAEAGPLAGIFIPGIASNIFAIDLPHLSGKFSLIDMRGGEIANIAFANRVEIDVSHYPPGIYVCRLSTEEGFTKTRKLLVTR